LPEELNFWQKIEEISRRTFSIYNYQEIRAPIIEEAGLFNRSLGEFTEIVQKQMFLIQNKEDLYALRPEGTAGVVRAYIENSLDKKMGFSKFYYIGPMFRLERPQKGRLRQFHHIGSEVIGSCEPCVDVELISLADNLLKSFSISDYKILVNSLGCVNDKLELIKMLQEALKDKLEMLCEDCNVRFKNNILRILDCKNESCQKVIHTLNLHEKYLCSECRAHFASVKHGLNALKIDYEVSQYLVRGLDYYTRTVFEIKHDKLGAQDAIGAGGRYDNLVKQLGGPDVGAMGFAFGIERLLLLHRLESGALGPGLVYLISLGDEAKKFGMQLLDKLRKAGIGSDTDYENKTLKGAMRQANDRGARFVVIIGDNELKKNIVILKDMASGEQKEIKQEELISGLSIG